MPINSVSELRKTGLSELDYTQYLLSGLKEDQLEAVQAVIIAMLKSDGGFDETGPVPFQPQAEAQLLARIDHSLAQIGTGEFSDAEDVENELLAEIIDCNSLFGFIISQQPGTITRKPANNPHFFHFAGEL